VLQIACEILFRIAAKAHVAGETALEFVQVAVSVLVACWAISVIFKAGSWRSLLAWLPTLIPAVPLTAFVFLVLRPHIVEAFKTPANSMAPTLLGNHWRGICPVCGSPNYGPPVDDQVAEFDSPPMICDNFHVSQDSEHENDVYGSDRFLVCKFLKPRRWDLVVFWYPEEPATLYVKRLVGLPGEEIVILDGAVWANGQKLTPPDSIHGIEYIGEESEFGRTWGTPSWPAVLDEDEYFVLGDFSARSKDSRYWETGAPGYHPYAVPKSHLNGVVTHIYWPPSRWRILR
jgi:signal peptidase I